MKIEIKDDITIKIGRNKEENWEMLQTNPNFTWLHLNSFPSGYVIIESENPDNEMIQYATYLCKNNTKYKNMKNLKICYTLIENVIKGEKVGEVYFTPLEI
jgi:hypothetical protein